MRFVLLLFLSFGGHLALAQAEEAWRATGGACDLDREPHSYACMAWNFEGNPFFPLFDIDWHGRLQGEWFAVTYADFERENDGSEFFMAKNPRRPSQPLGIFNVNDDTPVGKMWIHGDQWTIQNWRGARVSSIPSSLRQTGRETVQLQMSTFENGRETSHAFNCRDFNRQGVHHLLCRWMVWYPRDQVWLEKGFLGFLPKSVWDQFTRRL